MLRRRVGMQGGRDLDKAGQGRAHSAQYQSAQHQSAARRSSLGGGVEALLADLWMGIQKERQHDMHFSKVALSEVAPPRKSCARSAWLLKCVRQSDPTSRFSCVLTVSRWLLSRLFTNPAISLTQLAMVPGERAVVCGGRVRWAVAQFCCPD